MPVYSTVSGKRVARASARGERGARHLVGARPRQRRRADTRPGRRSRQPDDHVRGRRGRRGLEDDERRCEAGRRSSDLLANLAVSALALDPTNPSVLYAGTGEGFGNSDGVRGARDLQDDGRRRDLEQHRRHATGPLAADFHYVNDLVAAARRTRLRGHPHRHLPQRRRRRDLDAELRRAAGQRLPRPRAPHRHSGATSSSPRAATASRAPSTATSTPPRRAPGRRFCPRPAWGARRWRSLRRTRT